MNWPLRGSVFRFGSLHRLSHLTGPDEVLVLSVLALGALDTLILRAYQVPLRSDLGSK